MCSWPSYFTVTIPFCCYHIWHCVRDLHILLWQHVSVVTTLFDIVFLYFKKKLNFPFSVTRPFCCYHNICFWPSHFTVTRPFCSYHHWHCVFDLHNLLLRDLSIVTINDIMFLTFIFYRDKTFLLLPQYLALCSSHSDFTVTILSFTTIYDILFLTFLFYCEKTLMFLPQYLTFCSWPSYFTLTKPFSCYYNNWHFVLDLHILLWQSLSDVITIFDIVFLNFIFYCDSFNAIWHCFLDILKGITATRPFCCNHNIWHYARDLHIHTDKS